MRHEYSRNRPGINAICLGLTKAKAFPENVGVQWVDDKGMQTVVKKEPEDLERVTNNYAAEGAMRDLPRAAG